MSSYKDFLNYIICENPTENCFFLECQLCPGIDHLKNLLRTILLERKDIKFSQWVTSPKTTLEKMIMTSDDFINYFSKKLLILLPHAYIAEQQAQFSRTLKENLKEGEFLVDVDFAENYEFTIQDAAPGFHWNNDAVTIYNIVIYYKKRNVVNHRSLVIVSDCMSHDAVAVYTYHQHLISFLNDEFSVVNKIYYFSDGAPQRYKNYKNVQNLLHHFYDYGVHAKWHYHPTAHGKGPCDGLGASVKRAARKASLQAPASSAILTCQELYNWLSTSGRMKTIDFKYSPQQEYQRNLRSSVLKTRFGIKSRVTNLQEKHCLIPMFETRQIRAKAFSASANYEDNLLD